MFEREVTARRLFRNDKKRQTVRSTPADTLQTVDFVRCYVVSSGVYAMLRAIPCPNVAWSGVELHLECVGPSIILLCKYLHKETGLLPLAKTRESSRGTLFFNTIYSYGERESVRKDKGEEKRGTVGQETRRKWWEGVDGHAKKKNKKNTGTIRQMKKQDLGYREEKMAERRRRKQSNL